MVQPLWRFLKKLKIKKNKKLKIELPYDPAIHSWAYIQKKL